MHVILLSFLCTSYFTQLVVWFYLNIPQKEQKCIHKHIFTHQNGPYQLTFYAKFLSTYFKN